MVVAVRGELRQHGTVQPAGGLSLSDKQKVAAIQCLPHPNHIHGVVAADGGFAGNKSVRLPVCFDERLLPLGMFGEKSAQCRFLRRIGAQRGHQLGHLRVALLRHLLHLTHVGRAGVGDHAAAAREHGTTRAVASVEKAAQLDGPVIFAVGNAPTALFRIKELAEEGCIYPLLVVGVPVGFVNVVEAKEALLDSDIAAIVARGRKGGSTVAAAIMNALLYSITRTSEGSGAKA